MTLATLFSGSFLSTVVLETTPILLAALGCLYTMRANILNVALEGIMLIAAFCAISVGAATHSAALGVAAAVISGMLVAVVFGYISLYMRAGFIVAGIGINIFASGATVFMLERLYNN